jgi:hypothetical protein
MFGDVFIDVSVQLHAATVGRLYYGSNGSWIKVFMGIVSLSSSRSGPGSFIKFNDIFVSHQNSIEDGF